MDYESAANEKPEDLEKNPAGVVRRWNLEIKLASRREEEWRKKGERVWKRYRQAEVRKHSFNILWSNTETLRPAIYNSLPKPDVRRRFKDEDPIGKAVSEVLSRSLEYTMDTTDFDCQIKKCVLDMLLPGRGIARVRYVPSFRQVGVDSLTHSEDMEQHQEGAPEALEGDSEELDWEQVPVEHVQWDDFRMGTGKEWQEVCWVAFRHRLTRDELEEQFGEVGKDVPLDASADEDVEREKDEAVKEAFKTAEVWEIWDKDEKEVLFIASAYKDAPLKTIPDPLSLQSFFPCPKPLYAFEDGSNTVPVPLFEMYKEQADELDTVTKRINILIKGLKMRGIYDSTLSELSELMRGEDNDLIPASNVTALLERGGLEKSIWFMPIEQAAKVLQILQLQREATKQVIYEITGISDILRGSTNASETATAQQIKSQWGSMRLKRIQADVAYFIRDLMRMQAELIGEKFQIETYATMTGLKYPTGEEKQQAIQQFQMQMQQYQQMQAQAQMAQQQGQQAPQLPPPPQQPQLPPSWDEITQVLRDDKLRTFKVDVETDSTVASSMESDMAALKDVLNSVGQVVKEFGPAVQMGYLPVEALKELLMTVTRRAKMGNAVEDAFDKIKQPPPPPPQQQPQDNSLQVEQMRQQGEQQKMQTQLQFDQQKAQLDAQTAQQEAQMNAQIEQMRFQHEKELEMMRMQAQAEREQAKSEMDASVKILIAQIGAKQAMDTQMMAATQAADQEVTENLNDDPINQMAGMHSEMLEGIKGLVETLKAPKRREVLRGADGRATGTIEYSE